MIRLAIVILLLAFGYDHGGWYGALGMLLVLAAVLSPFAYGQKAQQVQQRPQRQDPDFSTGEQVNVRKGQRVDPTRPTTDDYAAMITDNYGHRRK